MSKFTAEFIQQQREIAAKASVLPWHDDGSSILNRDSNSIIVKSWGGYYEEDFPNAKNNTPYIVAAANNYPDALDEIERLQTEIAALRLALDEANQHARACEQAMLDAKAETERLRGELADANEDADHLSMCIEFDTTAEAAIKCVNDHHNRLTKPKQEAKKES